MSTQIVVLEKQPTQRELRSQAAALVNTFGLAEALERAIPLQLDLLECIAYDVITRDRIAIVDELAVRSAGYVTTMLDHRRIRAELEAGQRVDGARVIGQEFVLPASQRETLYEDSLRALRFARALGVGEAMGLQVGELAREYHLRAKLRIEYDHAALMTAGYTAEALDWERIRKVLNAGIPIKGAEFDGVEFVLRPLATEGRN